MNRQQSLGLVFTMFLLTLLVKSAVASTSLPDVSSGVAMAASSKPVSKLTPRLYALAQSSALRAASVADQAQALSVAPDGPGSLMRDAQGRVLVEVRTADVSDAFQQSLRNAGARIEHVSERYQIIAAWVDTARLGEVEALPAAQSIQEVLAPIVGHSGIALPASTCPQGVAISEGDTQLRAALARSAYSLSGAGVQVGVLSDSYDWLGGAAADVTSGDLPGTTNTCASQSTPVNVLYDYSASGAEDEGRAMAQIVHDLAPNATLSFATAEGGQTTFADHIRALKTAGANVIVDDIIYFDEPYFQDGIVTVGISDVVRTGALYFTAATNAALFNGGNNVASNEAPAYRPTSCRAGVSSYASSCHNFNPSGGTQNSLDFTLQAGYASYIVLQYAEPWYGVTTDLNLIVTNDSDTVVAHSNYNNLSTQEPFEYTYLYNSGGSGANYHISVGRYTAGGGDTANPRLKVVLFTNCNCGISGVSPATGVNGDIVGPTIMGHTASHDALSLAAAPYNDDNNPEGYSSRGPAAHYFGPVVNTTPAAAIPTEAIQQPDFTATDGGCNTFFGVNSGCWRFYGTSAAAPHAAAIAALLKQQANALGNPLSRDTAKMILQTTARSMSGGNLNSVGAGLIDAYAAVGSMLSEPPTLTSGLVATGTLGSPFSYTVTASGTQPITLTVAGLPAWAHFTSPVISGTPTLTGTFPVTLTATNSAGSDQKTLNIVVVAEPPTITSGLVATGTVGLPFSYTVIASGTQPITLTVAGLPAWAHFTSPVISGTPTLTGTFPVTLTATNSAGSDQKTLDIVVVAMHKVYLPLVIR